MSGSGGGVLTSEYGSGPLPGPNPESSPSPGSGPSPLLPVPIDVWRVNTVPNIQGKIHILIVLPSYKVFQIVLKLFQLVLKAVPNCPQTIRNCPQILLLLQ